MEKQKPVSMADIVDMESKEKKKKKKKTLFQRIKDQVSGPSASEAATGFVERMKKGYGDK